MALIERRWSPSRGRKLSLYEAVGEKFLMTRVGYWYLLNVAPRLDRFLIPRTKGKLSSMGKNVVGLLTCTGAKSGQERTLPLTAMRRDGHWLLIGSNYGREKAPPWVHNLRANPSCAWTHEQGRQPKVATELEGAERDEAFTFAKDFYAGYATYERMASNRTIAVFRLDDA